MAYPRERGRSICSTRVKRHRGGVAAFHSAPRWPHAPDALRNEGCRRMSGERTPPATAPRHSLLARSCRAAPPRGCDGVPAVIGPSNLGQRGEGENQSETPASDSRTARETERRGSRRARPAIGRGPGAARGDGRQRDRTSGAVLTVGRSVRGLPHALGAPAADVDTTPGPHAEADTTDGGRNSCACPVAGSQELP